MSEKSKSHGRLAIRPSLKPRVLMTDTPELENAWTVKVITLFPESFPPPAGGGAGMVLKADVVGPALEDARRGTPVDPKLWPVIYMSPRGKPLTQSMAQAWSEAKGMTILWWGNCCSSIN